MSESRDDPWLTTEELAARLRKSVHTLHDWAYKGTGPKFAKMGRHRRYRLSDILAWEHQREAGA